MAAFSNMPFDIGPDMSNVVINAIETDALVLARQLHVSAMDLFY
jgi:hypothetical protein